MGPVQDVKLVIVGDGGCGKTCLLMVYTTQSFPEVYVPTVFENYTANVALDKKTVKLSLWDTAGQEDYDRLRPLSYPDTDILILCYSIDSHESLNNISEKWAPEVMHFCGPNVPRIVVGTKSDMRADPIIASQLVSYEEGADVARRIGAQRYIECSAKYGENVDQVFTEAIRSIWENEKRRGSGNSGGSGANGKKRRQSRCCIS